MTDHEFASPNQSDRRGKRTLIFGGGYVGRRVADLAAAAGDEVFVTTRSVDKATAFTRQGFGGIVADWGSDAGLASLARADADDFDRILIAVSYDPKSSISRYESQVLGLQRLLKRLSPRTSIVYISTTGVYHQSDGQWVDENSPARPRRDGGRIHLMAEQLIRQRGNDSTWTVLRLAGIYGPGRVPLVRSVQLGIPIASPAEGFLNLIHVDDAAAVTQAAWQRLERLSQENNLSTAGRLFVVADDSPIIRRDFYREVARRCGFGAPTFTEAANTVNRSMRSASNKRVWNRLMKRNLRSRLSYPSYREGLADILR